MKFFNGLFRRKKEAIDIATTAPPPTTEENSRSVYYADMLLKADLEPLTKKKQFLKFLEEAPIGKVIVFFNVQMLDAVSEQHFVALDEYINLAKKGQTEKAFYRGLFHGPCVLSAFSKNCIPKNFDGSFFFGCPVLVMYF